MTLDDMLAAGQSSQTERPPARPVLGVDLGGTKIRIILADPDGVPLAEEKRPTPAHGGSQVIAEIADMATAALRASGAGGQLAAVGIGVPGVAQAETGGIAQSPNIAGMADLDMAGELGRALGCPVLLDNDANAAALGEAAYGVGKTTSDFVFIALGTGVGMGIVAGGTLLRGASGAAGEIGYLPIGTDPRDRANQVRGPLEEALHGAGIAARYRQATGVSRTTAEVIDLAGAATSSTAGVASSSTDQAAIQALDDFAATLALAIQCVHAVLDPALVVLGGGVGSRAEVRDAVVRHIAALTSRPPTILTSTLGPRAAALGAVRLAHSCAASSSHSQPIRKATS